MDDFKLKLVLSLLGGVLFSFVFILLALAIPIKERETGVIKKPKTTLEKVSESARNR